jgi:hypothetical protein
MKDWYFTKMAIAIVAFLLFARFMDQRWVRTHPPPERASAIADIEGFRVISFTPKTNGPADATQGRVRVLAPVGWGLAAAPIPALTNTGSIRGITVTIVRSGESLRDELPRTTYLDLRSAVARSGSQTPLILWSPEIRDE